MHLLVSVVIALCASSCKKESKKNEGESTTSTSVTPKNPDSTAASRPLSAPGGIVATVQLPSGAKMETLARAIDNFQPGASGMVTASLPMVLGQILGMDFMGVDLNGPISAVVLSPKKYQRPVALLVKPSDLSTLESKAKAAGLTVSKKGGLALVGDASVVEAAGDVAFGALATPPSEMVARIYPATLVDGYKDDLSTAMNQMSELMAAQQGASSAGFRTLMLAYEELILALGQQTEFIEVRVGSASGVSDLLMKIVPRAGTTMASLAQAQVASQHELLGKLPKDTAGTMLFSGELHAGAAQAAMIEFGSKIMGAIMPVGDGQEMGELLARWFESFDGKTAVNMTMDMSNPMMPQFAATYVWGTKDSDAMRKGWREMMSKMVGRAENGTLAMMGMKFDVSFETKVEVIDGVEVDRYQSKMNLEGLDEAQRQILAAAQQDQTMHMAAFDDVAIMAMSSGSAGTVASAISAARGKVGGYEPSGALGAAIERSKSMNESMVFAMDFGSMVPPEIPAPFKLVVMGIGQESGSFKMRMSVRK